jgi:hypothetical protein
MPLIHDGLARASLIAVRRAENVNEPQPHPCFCVTTVGTWQRLPGDWTAGYTWVGAQGRRTSDVGGNLLRRLELTGTPWVELLRTNRVNLDPLYFAIYADTVYHHGAGFRTGELSPAHRDSAPSPLRTPRLPGLREATRLINGRRWRSWEHRLERDSLRESQRVFDNIRRGGSDWLAELV